MIGSENRCADLRYMRDCLSESRMRDERAGRPAGCIGSQRGRFAFIVDQPAAPRVVGEFADCMPTALCRLQLLLAEIRNAVALPLPRKPSDKPRQSRTTGLKIETRILQMLMDHLVT